MLTTEEVSELKSFELLGRLEADRLQALLELGTVGRPRRGTVLLREGDPSHCAHLVLRGAVRLSRLTEDGERLLIGFLGPGSMVGEMGLLDGGPRCATAEAATDAVLLTFHGQQMSVLLSRFPEVYQGMGRQMVEKLRRATSQVVSASYDPVRERLLEVMADLGRRFGHRTARGVEIDLDLTHRELAEMVAAHRPTVSAVLKGLAEEGLLVRDGRHWVVSGLDQDPPAY